MGAEAIIIPACQAECPQILWTLAFTPHCREERFTMKDGIYHYSVRMSVPIGPRYGALELNISDGTAGGFLTMFSKRLPILEGSCCGGILRFSGEMRTMLYPLSYTAEGTVSGQTLRVVFHTEKGCFPAEGSAVTDREKEHQGS